MGGFLLALGLFTRSVAFVLAGNMAVAYFMAHSPRGFFTVLNAGSWQSSTASSSSISGLLGVANGASFGYVRPTPHPLCRRAGPEHHSGNAEGLPLSQWKSVRTKYPGKSLPDNNR